MKRFLLPAALMLLGAGSAMAAANVYASGLKYADGKISFVLNEAAEKVVLNLIQNGATVKSVELGAGVKGANTVDVPADVAEGNYNWSLTVSAATAAEPSQMELANDGLHLCGGRGLAINVYPETPNFGNMYASIPPTFLASGNGAGGSREAAGVYAFTADMETINEAPYTEGLNLPASGASSPYSLKVGEEGDLFAADWGDGTGSVYMMKAGETTFSDVFANGERADNGRVTVNGVAVHGSVQDIAVWGKGADRILYTQDEDLPDGNGIYQYNIGNLATPWDAAPSKFLGTPWVNNNNRLAADGRGGLWVSQYRWNEAEAYPCLFHVTAEGVVDFKTGDKSIFLGNTNSGDMAVNKDHSLIAMVDGSDGYKVYVARVSWGEDGVPALEKVFDFNYTDRGARPINCAFDYANNLYAIFNNSGAAGGITGWQLPLENVCTTPANGEIKVASAVVDLTVEAENAPAVYYNLQGVRVANPQAGNLYIRVNGNKAA